MLDSTEELEAWVGRETTAAGDVSPHVANMLGATLLDGWSHAHAAKGEVAPRLWHWSAFPYDTPMSGLARDGHPALGDFLPPVPLDRRMWAGGALTFHQDIRIGEALERRSRIDAVTAKSGSAGDMVFVTVSHEINGERGLAISERQDIVYLAIPERFTPPKKTAAPNSPDHAEAVVVDEVRLFRFSAATFNAHRIHYDLPYAQEVEKYPGLIVHGPLQAMLLFEAATRWRGAAPSEFSFRGAHPMFNFDDARLLGVDADGEMQLCTAADDHQCLTAKARWK